MTDTLPRLLLFDIDGTLLRTKGAGRHATREAMLEVFGTASRIDTHDFGGKPDWQTLIELLSDYGYDEARVGEYMPAFEDAMSRHLTEAVKTRPAHTLPGAMEAILAVRQRNELIPAIVTGNTGKSAAVKLHAAGYDPDWFVTGAYGSESVDRNALPPMALQRATAICNCELSPQRTFVIGDTLMDIRSAREMGAVAVAVTTGFTTREVLAAAEPDYLLDDLRELLELV